MVRKNKKKQIKKVMVGIVVFFGLLFILMNPNLLSIVNLSSTDFTFTDTELNENGKIQLAHETRTFLEPIRYYNKIYYAENIKSDSASASQFCYEKTGSSNVKFFDSSSPDAEGATWYENDEWNVGYFNYYIKKLVCELPALKTSGKVEQTNPITTTEPYTTFFLEYDVSLNGQTLKPYLLVGPNKHYFESGMIELPKVPSDTQVKVGADFEGNRTHSAELDPVVNLDMSYVEANGTVVIIDSEEITITNDDPEEEITTVSNPDSSAEEIPQTGKSFFEKYLGIIVVLIVGIVVLLVVIWRSKR